MQEKMNMKEATTQEAGQSAAATEANGSKAPLPGDVKDAIQATMRADEQTIAEQNALIESQKARIAALEANQKPITEKKPVSDSEFAQAVATLTGRNKADPSKLNISLSSILGFIPQMTDEQKKLWRVAKGSMEQAYSAYWKSHAVEVQGHLRRAISNPKAIMGGRIAKRKTDSAVTSVSLRAKNLAKPLKVKGRGKNAAKPEQVTKTSKGKSAHAEASSNPATVS